MGNDLRYNLQTLFKERDGFKVYNAGLPDFPRNFTRDSILAAFLFDDMEMLEQQLRFCASHQGTKRDPKTGEEPGKIHHELPGYPFHGRLTTYNSCDGTALFVIGLCRYTQKTGSTSLLGSVSHNLDRALNYIRRHIHDGFFEESPAYSKAKHFALRVTYWKDSVILDRENGEPKWPAVFTLAQAQNLCAVRAAARLLDSTELMELADAMSLSLQSLYDEGTRSFLLARDSLGDITGISSDALHLLYYLEQDDIAPERLLAIVESSRALETDLGYRTLSPELAHFMEHQYHANTIWPFEQAFIHAAAKRFGLERVKEVSHRIVSVIKSSNNEIFTVSESGFEPGGCFCQLWTIGAKAYFEVSDRGMGE